MAKQTFTTGQVLTAAQMTSLQQTAMGGGSPVTKTTSYVLVAADAGTVIQMNSASATTITVNTALFAAGDSVQIQNIGAGVCTVTAGTATVTTAGSLDLSQWEGGSLYFTSTSASIFFDVVQSSTTVPTSYGFTAGKNAILNSDFRYNQRAFTSNTTTGTYNFDRWLQTNSGGSFTVTPQTFTAGAAPVAGYESTNFLQGITATQSAAGDYAYFTQRVEDVRTNAGTTIVVSFWAKANTGTPKISVELSQNFGSGGSPSAQVNTPAGAVTLSTAWARYSVSVSIPSISGKTIGTTANTSYLELNLWTSSGATNATRASSIGIQNFTAGIWGVQLEQGTTATAFQTATGTIQGELAACQRYFYNHLSGNAGAIGVGYNETATSMGAQVKFAVTMRTVPSLVVVTGTNYFTFYRNGANDDFNSFTIGAVSENQASIYNNSEISGTAGQAGNCYSNNASARISFSAEL
jgi:hypothetical protein